ncbi:uncharacterized protein LOC104906193 [Beta vulgaris subsp. vulgaris]|uniref:uncharacterized protein LOC104906193 n=1 Tax=Beta vulgaris subsp. vulgaris TaxID=3555 RepID=UPI002036DE5E|nr:uncharacterized protein LOC104906193 [Beta vulgaris subsp. vulgaris]
MAVELFTENPSSRGISPRISFSHDLKNSEITPIEPHIPLKSSLLDYEFDFCVTRRSSDQEASLADELFANGVILPIQIKKRNIPIMSKSQSYSPSSSSSFLPPLPPPSSVLNSNQETEEKQGNNSNNSKSFWTFKRSKSLNCGSIYKRGLCPLPLLSRSKSTGSTISAKRSLISKDENHQNVNGKQNSLKNSNHQKPPLKKNYGGSSFNSGIMQVNPILNVPTGKVFGFGSIFSTGKDKNRKK